MFEQDRPEGFPEVTNEQHEDTKYWIIAIFLMIVYPILYIFRVPVADFMNQYDNLAGLQWFFPIFFCFTLDKLLDLTK